jgi:MFS family permease
MADLRALRPVTPILFGAALMLSLSLGIRQSLGLFAPQLTRDLAISMSDFTLAIAIQNLAWGLLQAVAGAMVVKHGYRPLMVGGAALYVTGLVLLATAQGLVAVIIGAGICIGVALSCTARRWRTRLPRAPCRRISVASCSAASPPLVRLAP